MNNDPYTERMPDRAYFDHNYGTCLLSPCSCLKAIFEGEHPWLGTACPNWKPLDVASYDELAAIVSQSTGG